MTLPTRQLGGVSLRVTVLGFGAASIGNLYRSVSDAEAHATVHAAWQGGVRYFDTAPHYGMGLSERRLGAALAGYPRADYVISTKVGRILEPNPAPTGSDLDNLFDVPDDLVRRPDYSADGVRRSLEESLGRLGLDRVDIALVHDPDDHLDQAITEALPALFQLRDEGVVSAVGVGMNAVAPLRRVVAEADVDCVMVAGRWTLLDRSAEPLLADCQRRGVSALAAAPFNSGILASNHPSADSFFDYTGVPAPVLARAEQLASICAASGIDLPAAAIQFPLRHPAVTAVVAGMGSESDCWADSALATTAIPENVWERLAN
ncbi:MAG: oxidoreductase [Jatrophihabitans sp.]|jgi:D-threo-aldose 1-dehydrogenase|nr:oxidoreductase [Jatrophihabitans sp.]